MDQDRSENRKPNPIVPLPPLSNEERACNVGDLLQIRASFEGREWDGQTQVILPSGQIYEVVSLKGRGWDLALVLGDGPREIPMMNWDARKYFRLFEGS
jgi:hypothetical protein